MTAPLRLVIFDVDGTLVDSQGDIIASMHHAFADIGAPAPERAAIKGIIGLSLDIAMARLAPGLDAAAHEALVAGYKRSYLGLRAQGGAAQSSPLFPGTREMLEMLGARDDLLLGIATGKSRRGLDKLLEGHGLAISSPRSRWPISTRPSRIPRCCTRHWRKPASTRARP